MCGYSSADAATLTANASSAPSPGSNGRLVLLFAAAAFLLLEVLGLTLS